MLLLSLGRFYNCKGKTGFQRNNIERLIEIIEGSYCVSLRLIDWFVTNYSKKFNTVITRVIDNDIVQFNVYLSYRSQLKAYSKQQFDPFRRRDRIYFYYDKDKYVETTVGQLNFFRWVLQNDILAYIQENSEVIEEDMVNTQKENHKRRMRHENLKVKVMHTDEGETFLQMRKRRNELSRCMMRNMNVMTGSMTVKFD
jgi:hypothetical protein